MSTFLFDKIVFGPVRSRRLGVSLGVNLLPIGRKVCNFDCVYCECGLNNERRGDDPLPLKQQVYDALQQKLSEMVENNEAPDVITFAGNGEPTVHPQFAEIIEDTIALRNQYFPNAKVSVLSNSTMLHKAEIVNALKKVDQNILKLDSGIGSTIEILNQPTGAYNVNDVIANLQKFDGYLTIQTMFVQGEVQGKSIDNTTEPNLYAWEEALKRIAPQQVMIYTIERDTPHSGIKKVSVADLKNIAKRIEKLGIEVQVYG